MSHKKSNLSLHPKRDPRGKGGEIITPHQNFERIDAETPHATSVSPQAGARQAEAETEPAPLKKAA